MENILYKYFRFLYPQSLEENEYIRLIALIKQEDGSKSSIPKFVKTFEEYEAFVNKYKTFADVYNTVATVIGKDDGKRQSLYRFCAIGIDIDAKDYPQIKSTDEHLARIKAIIPDLFNHCAIASGSGGVHVYYQIEPSKDIERVNSIWKSLAEVLGGDTRAAKETQILRIPTTFNQKQDPPKLVRMLNCTVDDIHHYPYKLITLERRLRELEKGKQAEKALAEKADVRSTISVQAVFPAYTEEGKSNQFYCIRRLLEEGVEIGCRNAAIGRIANYLELQGYTHPRALEIVLQFNQRCRPPKPEKEVKSDLEGYWSKGYHLLGCDIDDPRLHYLSKFCDKTQCSTPRTCRGASIRWEPARLRRCEVKESTIKKLKGFDYLILNILHMNQKGLTVKEIKKWITCRKTQKPCLSDQTLSSVLKRLDGKFIERDSLTDKWRIKKVYNSGADIIYPFSACAFLINGVIKQSEFKVLICIIRNLRDSKPLTEEELAHTLNMKPQNVSTAIRGLHKAHVINIESVPTEKGYKANKYTLLL